MAIKKSKPVSKKTAPKKAAKPQPVSKMRPKVSAELKKAPQGPKKLSEKSVPAQLAKRKYTRKPKIEDVLESQKEKLKTKSRAGWEVVGEPSGIMPGFPKVAPEPISQGDSAGIYDEKLKVSFAIGEINALISAGIEERINTMRAKRLQGPEYEQIMAPIVVTNSAEFHAPVRLFDPTFFDEDIKISVRNINISYPEITNALNISEIEIARVELEDVIGVPAGFNGNNIFLNSTTKQLTGAFSTEPIKVGINTIPVRVGRLSHISFMMPGKSSITFIFYVESATW